MISSLYEFEDELSIRVGEDGSGEAMLPIRLVFYFDPLDIDCGPFSFEGAWYRDKRLPDRVEAALMAEPHFATYRPQCELRREQRLRREERRTAA